MTQIEKHPSAETRVVPDERSRSLMRLERVLHEAEGETPRALVRMPDDAVKETERIKKLRIKSERLSMDDELEMALDPKTDKDILDVLSRNKDVSIRCGVARSENVSAETLERLSRDKNAYVRSWVARNRNVSVEILERLKNDSDKYVRDMAIKTLEKIQGESGIM